MVASMGLDPYWSLAPRFLGVVRAHRIAFEGVPAA